MFSVKKCINIIDNKELLEIGSLKKAFEKNSIIDDIEVSNNYIGNKIGDIVHLTIKSTILKYKDKVAKIDLYFPDYRETYTFSKILDCKGNVTCEVFFAMRNKKKTYFNYVISDNYNNILSSESVVFDECGRVAPLIEIQNMISDLKIKDAWIEKVEVVDSLNGSKKSKVVFKTEFYGIKEPCVVKHIWQNMTETKVIDIHIKPENQCAISELTEEDAFFSCNMWQTICMDKYGKFVLQGSIEIK
ncbi:DUF5944 family protein [Clostridium perfringens]|uniref:DUF5944 family protein n=1 Tax=Clostridium perfringens TaxID=1502 RepID=UPI001121E047|nr:DUF5944 family protein [Clostridium perfringens]TPE20457.1 hypothetical protein FJM09_03305 [Clostridium perfringens]